MIYTFKCFEDEDGCGHVFEVVMTPATYTADQQCPHCSSFSSVHRFYEVDEINSQVRLADSELKTVGHLAARNTEKFSEEQLAKINYEQNSYRFNREKKDLPRGMKRASEMTKDEKYLPVKREGRTREELLERSKTIKEKAKRVIEEKKKQDKPKRRKLGG
jgi:hypothetical protein